MLYSGFLECNLQYRESIKDAVSLYHGEVEAERDAERQL